MTAAPGVSAIDPAIYRNILANMADGVLTLDMTGRIVAFNPAAGRLLGIDPGAAVGRSFAEVFLLDPELDAFNELVIEAVHDRQIGQTRDVNIGPADQRLTLSAPTTYLCDDAPA
jgi:PAS domain S-box-containing protein